VKIITLPRENLSKIDIAEYMKEKKAADFNNLVTEAEDFFSFASRNYTASDDKVIDLISVEKFIKEHLLKIDPLYRNAYIDKLKLIFKLNADDICTLKKSAKSWARITVTKNAKNVNELSFSDIQKLIRLIKNEVHFDVIGKIIMKKHHIITLSETKELYLYQDHKRIAFQQVHFLSEVKLS
jgi:uncharacterized protein (UPF0305 family)